jgi:AcrR family transcriptional regulator
MDLYLEQGFTQTTVAEIAERAGVTPRTFFRHFADKREVLFAGSDLLLEGMAEAIASSPEGESALSLVSTALLAACEVIGENREFSRRRQSVITANPDLQERELMKMATLAAALAEGLRARGVPDADAGIVAETGIALFRVSFERWVSDTGAGELTDEAKDSLKRLKALTA